MKIMFSVIQIIFDISNDVDANAPMNSSIPGFEFRWFIPRQTLHSEAA